MKSSEEFNNFYNNELRQIILKIEEKRLALSDRFSFKRYKRNLKLLAVACIAVAISREVYPDIIPKNAILALPLSFVYAIFAPLYIVIRRHLGFDPINAEYKQNVIVKIITFLDSQLSYDPKGEISLKEFNESGLFEKPLTYRSEDLVKGKTGEIAIRVADVYSTKRTIGRKQYVRNTHTSSGPSILFWGMYAIAITNKVFPTRVLIRPTNMLAESMGSAARNLLGGLLLDLVGNSSAKDLCKTGNDEFDKVFMVSCVDQTAALRVLTPEFIQLVLSLRKEIDKPLYFSFFDSQMHIGFSGVNLFEGSANASFIEKGISKQYFSYLNMAIGMVEAQAER